MSLEGSSVKGCIQRGWTSGPNIKRGGPLFSTEAHLLRRRRGSVNDTTSEIIGHYSHLLGHNLNICGPAKPYVV